MPLRTSLASILLFYSVPFLGCGESVVKPTKDTSSGLDAAVDNKGTADMQTQDEDAPIADLTVVDIVADIELDDASQGLSDTTLPWPPWDASSQPPDIADVSAIEELWSQGETDIGCLDDEGLDLYAELIAPILQEEESQSCNQCHLSGMNLSMYAQGNACDTMSCLLAAGLVDFDTPEDSKVLAQILKAEPNSALITDEVIEKEYQAFLQWITHSASCHTQECPMPAEFCSGEPPGPNEPPALSPLGSCSEADAVNAFTNYVMKWKGRCHGCHTACEEDFEAPCWLVYDYDKNVPDQVYTASLISMFNLIGIGAINVEEPYQSTMLLKPLKVEYGGLPHGGGDKFADAGDEAYQDYVLWLDYYKNCYDNTKPTKPMVSLFKPNKLEKKYPLGEPATLHGFAEDPLEGVLSGKALVWTTDAQDEPVGYGTGPLHVVLPLGKQIITLTATNTKGLAGTRAYTVYVKE